MLIFTLTNVLHPGITLSVYASELRSSASVCVTCVEISLPAASRSSRRALSVAFSFVDSDDSDEEQFELLGSSLKSRTPFLTKQLYFVFNYPHCLWQQHHHR